MELKIDIQKKAKDLPITGNRNSAKAVSPELIVESAAALDIQDKPSNVKKVCVLRCGTVMLQNFTEALSEPGRQLKLVREPDNEYDRWATRVCALDGTMLGYLPSRKNQSVARLMDAGKNITVFVDEALTIPKPSLYRPSNDDARLPLILYMDITVPEENEQ